MSAPPRSSHADRPSAHLQLCSACCARRSYGDAAHCRKALHRAVQCTSDYPEHVCEVLLSFERVEGERLCLYAFRPDWRVWQDRNKSTH